MAAFDHIRNMHDIALKPRLLRTLIREHMPDEKHPLKGPSELSHVVSMVKTHRLLSESLTADSTDPKVVESWKAAVDSWVNRVLMLASSNTPDKCWAGICLLGVTCQECSSERFLASYSIWLPKLQSHIQPPADSHFVKVASCASLSDLFTRLGRFPRVKKDATSQAVKLVQPVLKLLNEDSSEAVWEGAVCLLCTFITFFPSSIHRCYDSAEAAVVSKILSGKCSVKMFQELGHCLALLPKSRGDEDSWSLMMQKILLSINVHLNDAFQGVEEESKNNEAMRLLIPPGKDPPPPLGGHTIGEALDQRTKRPERLQMSSVSTLMRCCCTMLTSSYPVQVRVPIRPLVALAGRVLMVDGSVTQALFPFMTAMQQEFICSELPILHLYSLELLSAVIKGVRSQLLPHAAEIVRLLTEYFKRCVLPDLRIKVYSIMRILLMSMGLGIAVYLAKEVIDNASVDLDSIAYDGGGTSSSSAYLKASNDVLLQPCQKKRKHASTASSLEEQPDRVDLEVGLPKNPTPVSVKIAALEALEALLTVGGALGAESWRPSIDCLLITVATNACKGGWAKEEKHNFLSSEPVLTWADFQLATLRALLASLLSPARFRPPHLAQGLELFRRGMRETGTKLGEFCAHALLALEVLIHPRALSLIDFSSASNTSFDGINNRFPDAYSYGHKRNTPFSTGTLGKGPDDSNLGDDDLYESWLANDDEIEIPVTDDAGKDKSCTEKPSETCRDSSPEKIPLVADSFSTRVPEENRPELVSDRVEGKGGEIMVEAPQFQEPIKQGDSTSRVISDGVVSDHVEGELATKPDDFATGIVSTAMATSNLERSKQLDVDSDMESLPDIVDGDPDSD
ncbi:Proline-, glutamic acid- and leucine-rich protein 1 [Camellia lanceoleosa]|uniref:Proline-, glutamic acid- and leucine-rich protein 1 n=1 Tax=Camellia lanceoleosa TaxID=1840588 RepID=A0ACC0J4T8_9ERIC|nr:Proline-, glutamic acid- and leucine-rich protein 1 [Camellia lanceoleosa]